MVVAAPTFAAPNEGILFQSPSTKLLINDQELGTATLYITENNVVWGGGVTVNGTPVSTITLMYPLISLHAVQREPSPALYMVLNYELKVPELPSQQQQGTGDTGDDDDDDDDDLCSEDHPITQLRFIPPDEGDLQAMYSAMTQGQTLHPDPQDNDDDDPYMDGQEFDDDELFEDAEEAASPEEAAARLRSLRINVNGVNHDENDQDEDIEE